MDSATKPKPRPNVGVGVIVKRGNLVLLGKRKSGSQIGSWAPPGGYLEWGETIEECTRRELFEETGMQAISPTEAYVFNDISREHNHHCFSVIMECLYAIDEPKALEPDKCEEWKWFDMDNLPEPLFTSFRHYVDLKKHDLEKIKLKK